MNKNIDRGVFGAACISLAAVMWGLDGIALTPRLLNLDVGFVVFLLHAIPFALMNLVFFRQYRRFAQFTRKDCVSLLALSFFGGALGTLALVKAMALVHFSGLSVVILLQKLQPVFAIALAAVLLKEKLRRDFAFWAATAIVGGYFLSFGFHPPNFQTGEGTTWAVILAFVAAISFASATVFGKRFLLAHDFATATFYRFAFTTGIMALYVLATSKFCEIRNVTPLNWAIFLMIAFTTGSGAIFLYYFGLKKVTAMVATVCELAFPISAILFDYMINGQTLSSVQWISVAVMLIAITKVSLEREVSG